MGGYEYKASNKWYFGLSEKYVITAYENNFYTRGNISHRGDFLKIKLNQVLLRFKQCNLLHLHHMFRCLTVNKHLYHKNLAKNFHILHFR